MTSRAFDAIGWWMQVTLERQGTLNAQLEGARLRQTCDLDGGSDRLLGRAVTRLGPSARGVARVLRVARTIGDLENAAAITEQRLAALQFQLPT